VRSGDPSPARVTLTSELREFPAGCRYEPAPGEQPTRGAALDVLSKLARGVDAARLLERVASHERADELRGVLIEVGAGVMAGAGGNSSEPGTAPGGSSPAGSRKVR
jgi:hypothetical protein